MLYTGQVHKAGYQKSNWFIKITEQIISPYNLSHTQQAPYLSLTICFHEFTKWCMPLNLELHHRTILASHLEVDVFIVFCFHAFLQKKLNIL